VDLLIDEFGAKLGEGVVTRASLLKERKTMPESPFMRGHTAKDN